MKKIKVNNNHNRKKLNEGRNYGMGFAILKKIKDDEFNTRMPFTACKDYLNDVAYTEHTNKSIGKIYGFNYKLQGIFQDDHFYLGINMLDHNNSSSTWGKKDEAEKILIDNIDNLIKFVNKVETKTEVPNTLTSIEGQDGGIIVLKVHKNWIRNGFLISLYTLLLRINFNRKKFSKLYLAKHKPFIPADDYLKQTLNRALKLKNIKQYVNYKYPKYEYDEKGQLKAKSTIHNGGVSYFTNIFKKQQIKC